VVSAGSATRNAVKDSGTAVEGVVIAARSHAYPAVKDGGTAVEEVAIAVKNRACRVVDAQEITASLAYTAVASTLGVLLRRHLTAVLMVAVAFQMY